MRAALRLALLVLAILGCVVAVDAAMQIGRLRLFTPIAVEAQGGYLNAGDIVIRLSGNCGTGFGEVSALDGVMLRGTVAAHQDQGESGGSDTITPEGTNSAPVLTMNSYVPSGTNLSGAVSAHTGTAVLDHAAHVHAYTEVLNHLHTLATGSGATGNFSQVIGTVDTSSGGTGGTPTQTTLATRSGNPVGGVASATTAAPSITLTHSVTQPSAHTMTQPVFSGTAATLTGTVAAPSFTGTSFDNRPAYTSVILCEKL